MNSNKLYVSNSVFSDSTVARLKKRIIFLITLSTLTVAIAFGLSFYFAFISSTSAISGQIPELEPVVSKMKSLLLVNTFGLVAIIIASLFILNRITVSRLFSPLGTLNRDMKEISEGRFPKSAKKKAPGSFNTLSFSFHQMLSAIRKRESEDIGRLKDSLDLLRSNRHAEAAEIMEQMIFDKNGYLTGKESGENALETRHTASEKVGASSNS